MTADNPHLIVPGIRLDVGIRKIFIVTQARSLLYQINQPCTFIHPFPHEMTTQNLFSVSIFFIVFRETLEAVVIVSVLLGLVEQIVHGDVDPRFQTITEQLRPVVNNEAEGGSDLIAKRRLVRKLRFQVCCCSSHLDSVIDS
jgi:hypothetical protein